MNQSINDHVNSKFNSDLPTTLIRKKNYYNFLINTLPSDNSINYKFYENPGDGNCFAHSIVRFLGLTGQFKLVNKNVVDMTINEKHDYDEVLNMVISIMTEGALEFDENYKYDKDCPEYQLLARTISRVFSFQIVILDYCSFSRYKPIISKFRPENDNFDQSLILINFSHHFDICYPISQNSSTKELRSIVAECIEGNV